MLEWMKNVVTSPFFIGIVGTCLGALFTFLITQYSYKRKENDGMPKVHLYPLDNNTAKENYVDKVLESKYIYLFEEKRYIQTEDNGNRKYSYDGVFKKITLEECRQAIIERQLFAICIYNTNPNYNLILSRYRSGQNNNLYSINNTLLSAIESEKVICIITSFECIPKSLNGSFKKRAISYEISNYNCTQIFPKREKRKRKLFIQIK